MLAAVLPHSIVRSVQEHDRGCDCVWGSQQFVVGLGDCLSVDEGLLVRAVEEVCHELGDRVPFNDSLSTEYTLDPCCREAHYYPHLDMPPGEGGKMISPISSK